MENTRSLVDGGRDLMRSNGHDDTSFQFFNEKPDVTITSLLHKDEFIKSFWNHSTVG